MEILNYYQLNNCEHQYNAMSLPLDANLDTIFWYEGSDGVWLPCGPDHPYTKLRERFKQAITEAEEAFWGVIAKKFPEVTSGDFAPDAYFEFYTACEKALTHWIHWNHPLLEINLNDI